MQPNYRGFTHTCTQTNTQLLTYGEKKTVKNVHDVKMVDIKVVQMRVSLNNPHTEV